MEERLERERKVWNEHRDLLLTSERTKFDEEKTRLVQELRDQVRMEQERCQRLEQQLYDAQVVGYQDKMKFVPILIDNRRIEKT
jgi:exonuclease VII large subunit